MAEAAESRTENVVLPPAVSSSSPAEESSILAAELAEGQEKAPVVVKEEAQDREVCRREGSDAHINLFFLRLAFQLFFSCFGGRWAAAKFFLERWLDFPSPVPCAPTAHIYQRQHLFNSNSCQNVVAP